MSRDQGPGGARPAHDDDDGPEGGGVPSLGLAAGAPPELARGFLTRDVLPVAGLARLEPEDFVVEEVPLYPFSGSGEHLYVTIEKRGIPTPEAIRRLARVFGKRDRDVGYAGLKDAHAVTRQTLSFQLVDAARLEGFSDPQIKVVAVTRHANKLKLGHLAGNRFTIRLRGVSLADEPSVRAVVEQLARDGAPNFFGLQRFGARFNSHRLGAALVRMDAKGFLDELLAPDGAATPSSGDVSPANDARREPPRVREAREAYVRGDFAAAFTAIPHSFQAERAALGALARSGADLEGAVRMVPLRWRRFYASALQSALFNAYLLRRLDRLDALAAGEVAFLERNGAAFLVTDPATDASRVASREISASGPLFGAKLLRPLEGTPARADEDSVLAGAAWAGRALGAELGDAFGASPRGERRSLRVLVGEPSVRRDGEDLVLGFLLPKGSYATSVLEEVLKRPVT